MTFQTLDQNPFLFISITLFIFTPLLATFAIVETVAVTTWGKRIFVYTLFVISLAGFIICNLLSAQIKENNEHKAAANLTQKYEVKDVDWKSVDTTADPRGLVKEDKILLTANNGEKYVFQYEVNPDTFEPKLIDMPIQGGNKVDREKSADALLKK